MTEVTGSGEDVTQGEDWFWLGPSTAGIGFDVYVSVGQEFMTCGVLCLEELCGVVEHGSYMEEMQGDNGDYDNEAESEPGLSFMEALHVFEIVRGFM